MLREAQLHPGLWNSQSAAPDYERSLLHVWTPVAAAGDEGLEEYQDLRALMDFAGQVIKQPSIVRDIYEQVRGITLAQIGQAIEAQLQDYQDKLSTPGPEQTYTVVRGGFDLVKGFFAVQQGVARIMNWVRNGSGWLGRMRTLLKNFQNPDFHATFKQLSSTQKKSFLEDFETAGPDVWKKLDEEPGMVGAWEKLLHADIPDAVRTTPAYLSVVSKQIKKYGAIIAFRFDRVLPHIHPNNLDDFFAALENPKSIDHVRSLVGDFERIPGISKTKYISNSLPVISIPAPGTWANPLLGLPGETAETFSSATAKILSPGQMIFRVLGEGQRKSGGFWTYELPRTKADLYGGTAVRPEWNSGTHYIEYIVPEGGLKVWDGPTARQPILDGIDEVSLPGGTTQIYIPDAYRQTGSNFDNLPLNKINLQ